jgi:SAM-dependent methyltransferase
VLDVGGGIGGPARALAATLGCAVTVLDLTEELCQVGAMLTARTGLAGLVRFHVGDALALPLADGSVDVGWTQHSTMNIADAARLYGELHRVVRRGGRLAMHEVVAGPVRPLRFPVPWAADAASSFLRPAEEVRAALAAAGFVERAWVDRTEASLAALHERAAAGAGAPLPPLGQHVLFGPGFPTALANLARSLEEGRAEVVMAVHERP